MGGRIVSVGDQADMSGWAAPENHFILTGMIERIGPPDVIDYQAGGVLVLAAEPLVTSHRCQLVRVAQAGHAGTNSD